MTPKELRDERLAKTLIKNLKRRHIEGFYCPTAEEAVQQVSDDGRLPSEGVALLDVKLAKGLEFDQVIIPDVQDGAFPDEPIRRHRLYTAISRATKRVTLVANGRLTGLLR